jgi:hypothetical protein
VKKVAAFFDPARQGQRIGAFRRAGEGFSHLCE